MQTPLLAAAMIVKNEERRLPAALESLEALKPLLGEVCIYDTGSTDATIEIAKAYGAKVVEGYWDSDFARARNEAAAMCSAKWVLVVDADERVVASIPALRLALREMLTEGMTGYDVGHAHMAVVNPDDTRGETWDMIRFYRANRCHYVGAVHEAVQRRDGGSNRAKLLPAATITVLHYGYDSAEAMAERGKRNTTSADIELARARDGGGLEKVATALLQRGRSLLLKGDVEGAEADFRQVWEMPIVSVFRPWSGEYLASLLTVEGRLEDAALIVRELRALGLDTRRCDHLLAGVRSAQGRHTEALQLLHSADGAINAAGMAISPHEIVTARLGEALACGEGDEAIACLIALMAVHGRASGHGHALMELWGDRPIELLVQLLMEASHGFTEAIVVELARVSGQGREVAARLRIAERRSAASSRL